MGLLQVEVADFTSAARSMFHEVAESSRLCLESAGMRLEGGLVGTDPAGARWAAAYDPAAASVLQATGRFVDAAYTTARLLAQSGHNYTAAEHASTTGRVPAEPNDTEWGQLLAEQPRTAIATLPTAGGVGADTPAGWWLVEHTLGYLWPAGHQDRLRTTAGLWRQLNQGISHVTGDLLAISLTFAVDHLPEADDITTVCNQLRTHADTLLEGYLHLADACDTYATHLDDCHTQVVDELTDLLRDSAAIQTAGALLTVVTFGGSEAAAQTGQAARITAAAARISTLIERVLRAAEHVSEAVDRVRRLANDITETLTALTTAHLAYAGITDVTRITRIDRLAMTTNRGERGVAAGSKAARLPERLRGRKLGDPGEWGDDATLEEHFGDHGAEVGATSEADYARRASDFLQEAERRGLPQKVDSKGNIRVWDPKTKLFGSYRRDGSTRTFFRPTSPTYFERQPGDLR